MGRDKAEIEIDGETLLERTARILETVADDVRIACGATPRYGHLGLPLLLDSAPDLGPLAGLQAALAARAGDGEGLVLAVACDMPRLGARLLRDLIDTTRANEFDVCVLRSTRGVEPLCGVWRTTMVGAIERALAHGERRVVAAFDELTTGGSQPRVGYIELDDSACTSNLNTPADLERERRGDPA